MNEGTPETCGDEKPSEKILKLAKEIATEEYKKENPNACGWEVIEEAVELKMSISYNNYLLLAILKYLDNE